MQRRKAFPLTSSEKEEFFDVIERLQRIGSRIPRATAPTVDSQQEIVKLNDYTSSNNKAEEFQIIRPKRILNS